MPNKSDLPDELAMAIGYALHEWSMVEEGLSYLFAGLTQMPDLKRPHLIMASIISFETRLAVTDTLVRHELLLEKQVLFWSKLSVKLSKSYKSRHQIAHFSLLSDYSSDNIRQKTVVAPFFSLGSALLGKNTELGVAEIKQKQQRFKELAEAVSWISRYLNMRRYSPEETHLQEPDLVLKIRAQLETERAES